MEMTIILPHKSRIKKIISFFVNNKHHLTYVCVCNSLWLENFYSSFFLLPLTICILVSILVIYLLLSASFVLFQFVIAQLAKIVLA